MNSGRKWTRSSTESVCLYSFSQVYGNSKEMDQELHRVLLLIFVIQTNNGIIKERDQKLHRSLCLYSSLRISRGRDQELHRGPCLYYSLRVCGISKGTEQELHRGLLLILLKKNCMESVRE
jgi:hypothetical protein